MKLSEAKEIVKEKYDIEKNKQKKEILCTLDSSFHCSLEDKDIYQVIKYLETIKKIEIDQGNYENIFFEVEYEWEGVSIFLVGRRYELESEKDCITRLAKKLVAQEMRKKIKKNKEQKEIELLKKLQEKYPNVD